MKAIRNIKNKIQKRKADLFCLIYFNVLLISYPKSGRTWTRIFLAKYFSEKQNIEFRHNIISPKKNQHSSVPSIYITHMGIPDIISWHNYLKNIGIGQKIATLLHVVKRSRVILIVRDPRDVLVSYYFDSTKRSKKDIYKKFTIKTMLRDEVYGINNIVMYMNQWHKSGSRFKNYIFIKYEDLKKDPEEEFGKIISFTHPKEEVNKKALKKTIQFSSFENMQSMERNGAIQKSYLKPSDKADANSYKVRKGKVGGFLEHFDEEDLLYAKRAMEKLDPEFGYSQN